MYLRKKIQDKSSLVYEWQIAQERKHSLDTVLVISNTVEGQSIAQKVQNIWELSKIPFERLEHAAEKNRTLSCLELSSKETDADMIVGVGGGGSREIRLFVEWEWYCAACTALVDSKIKHVNRVRVLPMEWFNRVLKPQHDFQLNGQEWLNEQKTRWLTIPSDIRDKLYPFQTESVEMCWRRRGRLLLADDMGLGKTLQSLVIMKGYEQEWPLLIVCLSSLKGTWKDAWNDWFKIPCTIFKNGKDVAVQLQKNPTRVYIISYDLLKMENVWPEIKQYQFRCVVLDEVHQLQSSDSQRTKVCHQLFLKADRVLALSGTPGERPADIWPIARLVMPELFPRWWIKYPQHIKTWDAARAFKPSEKHQTYAARYCDPKPQQFNPRMSVQWNLKGNARLRELSDIFRFYLYCRRTKAECAKQLPDKIRTKVLLEIQSEEDRLTLEKEMDKLKNLQGDEKKEQIKERQMMHIWNKVLPTVKGPLLAQYFQEEWKSIAGTKEKVLLFAHHEASMDILEKLLVERKWSYIRIDGSVKHEDRHVLCKKFCQDPNYRVALLSIKAAGTGLNLQVASLVYFAEMYWTAKDQLQAEDRAHRIGCKNNVLIKYLLTQDSLEPSIYRTISRKQVVQNTMFDTRSFEQRQLNMESTVMPTFKAATETFSLGQEQDPDPLSSFIN